MLSGHGRSTLPGSLMIQFVMQWSPIDVPKQRSRHNGQSKWQRPMQNEQSARVALIRTLHTCCGKRNILSHIRVERNGELVSCSHQLPCCQKTVFRAVPLKPSLNPLGLQETHHRPMQHAERHPLHWLCQHEPHSVRNAVCM